MTAPLPPWASTPAARALLDQIVAEQPDYALVRRDAWTNQSSPFYKGASARELRQLWEDAADAAMDAHGRDAWIEVRNAHADDLIERALEAPTLLDLMVQDLGGGKHRVAA